MSNPVLHLSNVCRSFVQAENRLDVLRGCNLVVHAKEKVALIGPSGAGKSTLLHIAGLLEKPDSGTIEIANQAASNLDDAGRTALRRSSIGFVYQFHHLLPEFSARENIILPQMIAGVSKEQAGKRADELLALIELSARGHHRPSQLSGGEQQRIAIARALANRPALLIADEPTGNLDPHTADHVFDVLQHVANQEGLGLLMATHNHDLAKRMNCVCELREGQLVKV